MHQSWKPLWTEEQRFCCLEKIVFLKSKPCVADSPLLGLRLGWKGEHWWQVKGYCYFKKPADWSVNMEKPGADYFSFKTVWDINQPPYYKIRKSKQRFTPINTPFIYFLQKYTEKIIKRFHLSCLFFVFFFKSVKSLHLNIKN